MHQRNIEIPANMSAFVNWYRYSKNTLRSPAPSECAGAVSKDSICSTSKDSLCHDHHRPSPSKKKEAGGLEVEILKLIKGAAMGREVEKGRRTPHGSVTERGRRLRVRAAVKRELQEIHGRVSGMC